MAHARKILLADPDLEAVRALSKALRQKDYQVHYAPDGSRALEIAVLRHPDLVLIDEACRLIEARTFINILRSNPRTDDIPVLLTTQSLDADRMRGLRDGYLRKPFNLDEALSRIEHVFRKTEAAKDLKGESREIEGNLAQLGIPDLLQIMAMNRRTGRLTLTRGTETGEIWINEGRPVNARSGPAEGDKAIFRLLSWVEGTFAFTPGAPSNRVRIQRSMDDALLEGMRQNDETARLLGMLPPRTARVQLAPQADLPRDQHPVTAQVVELLRQSRTISELLDLCPETDLDVLGVLATLLQKDVARIVEAEANEGPGPLLGPAEVHALRSRLLRGRGAVRVAVAKVFLCAVSPLAVRPFLARVPGFMPVSADPSAARSGFGTLGRIEVNEALWLDFCVLPASDAARPLWRPFTAGAVGAVLLDAEPDSLKVASFFASSAGVPLVVLGAELPPALVQLHSGSTAVASDPIEALRSLLILALHPAQAIDRLEAPVRRAQ
jgi:CheY-like chemotaxis protein